MRNFDEEIKEIERDIKNLEVTKKQKKTQLKKVKREQREILKTEQVTSPIVNSTIRDHCGK